MTVKNCPVCGVEFVTPPHGRKQVYCGPPCRGRASYLRNGPFPSKQRAYRREYENKRWKEDSKYRKARLEQARWTHLRNKYGITKEQFNELLEKQNFVCGVCGIDTPVTNKGTNWHVDHCHVTGKIRGLLCATCNSGLGHFKDNPETLRKAAEYLEAHL